MYVPCRRSFLLSLTWLIGVGTSSALAQETARTLPAPMTPLGQNAVTRLASAQEALLSGRVFVVATGKIDKTGKPASGQDVIRFNGTLMSTDLCDRFGFRPAAYHLRVDGGKLHFMATLVSAEQGELRFAGRITDDRLEAEADWRRPRWYGDVHVRMWYDGTLADPDAEHAAWLD